MIAHRDQCDPRGLSQMLDESLGIDEQFRVTQHLDQCPKCRAELERMAAEPSWWQDTRDLLSAVEQEANEPAGNSYFVGGNESEPEAIANPNPQLSEEGLSAPSRRSHVDLQAWADPAKGEHWVLQLLEPSPEPDCPGQIDGMPIDSVIGQGGMGVVLKARDKYLHRDLAIKLLSPMLASTGAARQRFLREAQAAASVVHPNIVPIYAVAADRKLPYLVMPFVGGGNLQQYLTKHGPLPLDRVLSIGLQVAEGLAAAHRQGIVHRDIKPANLMLDEGGFRVMLTDFGLARALDDATLTASGMLAGTPQYMSPEQARAGHTDRRSDIYSLGAVLYALATGRAPVRGTSTLEMLQRIGVEPPKPITEINETYPMWFESLIRKMMAPALEDRLPSAEQAAQLLRACLAHARSPHQAALPRVLRADDKHADSPAKKRIAFASAFLLATSLLILTGFGLAKMVRPTNFGSADNRPADTSAVVRKTQQETLEFDNRTRSTLELRRESTASSSAADSGASDEAQSSPGFESTPDFAPGRLDAAGNFEWYSSGVQRSLSAFESELSQLQVELGIADSSEEAPNPQAFPAVPPATDQPLMTAPFSNSEMNDDK